MQKIKEVPIKRFVPDPDKATLTSWEQWQRLHDEEETDSKVETLPLKVKTLLKSAILSTLAMGGLGGGMLAGVTVEALTKPETKTVTTETAYQVEQSPEQELVQELSRQLPAYVMYALTTDQERPERNLEDVEVQGLNKMKIFENFSPEKFKTEFLRDILPESFLEELPPEIIFDPGFDQEHGYVEGKTAAQVRYHEDGAHDCARIEFFLRKPRFIWRRIRFFGRHRWIRSIYGRPRYCHYNGA